MTVQILPRGRLAQVRSWIHLIGEEKWVSAGPCARCDGSGVVDTCPPEWWDDERDGQWDGQDDCPECGGSGERGYPVYEVHERRCLPARFEQMGVNDRDR